MKRNNMYKNGISQFDGKKYAFFRRRMKTYIQAQGFEICQSIVDGYKEPTVLPISEREIKLDQNNSRATNALLNGLGESIYTKFIHCKSDKDIWDKLQNIYEGDSKIKVGKLQTYRGQFEQLNMKEYKKIASYFLRFDETINAIIGLGE
jgi:hypothetical protein